MGVLSVCGFHFLLTADQRLIEELKIVLCFDDIELYEEIMQCDHKTTTADGVR